MRNSQFIHKKIDEKSLQKSTSVLKTFLVGSSLKREAFHLSSMTMEWNFNQALLSFMNEMETFLH